MAPLRMRAAKAALGARPTGLIWSGRLQTLRNIVTGEVPVDVRTCEVSVVILFRASVALNFLSGGHPEMTFSARCHRSRCTSRGLIARFVWIGLAKTIDAAYAALRNESEHCATAWANHVLRPGRVNHV